ncbi:hypothetical protein HN803_07910 [candidate division WWE3 bacterium]|jgi:hypothetical protein|nr:hypothetical protein [candidate division WWE3 bacterium]MBT7350677.1 hypothetical protein [candidate division WWE3 bacterium]
MKANPTERREISAFFAKLVTGKQFSKNVFSRYKATRKKAMEKYIKSARVLKILVSYPVQIRKFESFEKKRTALATWATAEFKLHSETPLSDVKLKR